MLMEVGEGGEIRTFEGVGDVQYCTLVSSLSCNANCKSLTLIPNHKSPSSILIPIIVHHCLATYLKINHPLTSKVCLVAC